MAGVLGQTFIETGPSILLSIFFFDPENECCFVVETDDATFERSGGKGRPTERRRVLPSSIAKKRRILAQFSESGLRSTDK
ncbi:hypothetical protein H7F51_11905 [Novosphingobium flavum]|uniref:Uncharacterized protein n=1 Tax=Novosphingobium flavum TaxID=1778672 RepID=A0A7X1KM39_9SPHN|nr:hypothetical protein [Novosphingobium flavum]MBC2666222.1 hypothetical protein [Novosphingobium flavum]